MQSPVTQVPDVSIILLDWSVRERFQALEWLAKQDLARDRFELIWVELHNRIVPQATELADVVITCGQRGTYHKHVGYNAGLLESRGRVVTVCDSDAVFTPDFMRSIVESFELDESPDGKSLVLMHHEWRTRHTYPDDLTSIEQLQDYEWQDLWPNVGACMSVRRCDAIRFGGFDEHRSFRGYMCGPYDLGWRLINAGIPEVWHDSSVALWHFAHPDPPATGGQRFSWSRWREITYAHIDRHALKAVEAFSTGRILPRKENPKVQQLRMSLRRIGSTYEEKYASLTGPKGFSYLQLIRMFFYLQFEPVNFFWRRLRPKLWRAYRRARMRFRDRLIKIVGRHAFERLRLCWPFAERDG